MTRRDDFLRARDDKCPCGKKPADCKGWEDTLGQFQCPIKPKYQSSAALGAKEG